LFQKRKFSPNTAAQHLAALRFFYVKTLKKVWSIAETPYPKKAVHLPTILSQEEVAKTAMFCSAQNCSTNSSDTGAACGESPAYGCFQATAGIPVIPRSTPRWSGTLAKKPPSEQVSRKRCTHIR